MLRIGAIPKAKTAMLKTVSATILFMTLPSFAHGDNYRSDESLFLHSGRPCANCAVVVATATEKPLFASDERTVMLRGSAGQRSRMSSKKSTSVKFSL